ncbi:MAG: hypothetical protein MJZ20_04650 [Bacteroidaceae bacterium]|nr:hypothetical protein [Bacteroidaceae bacterium]
MEKVKGYSTFHCILRFKGRLLAVLVLFTLHSSLFTREASAQTLVKLIEKYSKVEGAEYLDVLEAVKKGVIKFDDAGKATIKLGPYSTDYNCSKGSELTDLKFLNVEECEPSLVKKFWKGVKSLKNYSIVSNSDEGGELMRTLINVEVINGDSIVEAAMIDATIPEDKDDDASFSMMVIKGKQNPDGDLVASYKKKYTILSDDGEELVSADSEDALFSALVMIDGEIHPELHSSDDVHKYFDNKKEFKKGRKAYVFEDILMGSDKVKERFPESANIIAIIVKTIDNE